jgi:hypothetical protein
MSQKVFERHDIHPSSSKCGIRVSQVWVELLWLFLLFTSLPLHAALWIAIVKITTCSVGKAVIKDNLGFSASMYFWVPDQVFESGTYRSLPCLERLWVVFYRNQVLQPYTSSFHAAQSAAIKQANQNSMFDNLAFCNILKLLLYLKQQGAFSRVLWTVNKLIRQTSDFSKTRSP